MDKIKKIISDNNIEFIDFRFTDSLGKLRRITHYVENLSQSSWTDGINFDGSSIEGWKEINNSDMVMIPDVDSYFIDPFTASKTLVIFCDIIDPIEKNNYNRDPRSTAKKAENYLKASQIADQAFFGPELEFFMFDDVRFESSQYKSSIYLADNELPFSNITNYAQGNFNHKPMDKGSYSVAQPLDQNYDIRCEMIEVLKQVGLTPTLHHHEVSPSQHELGFEFDSLVKTADNVQKYKYVIHNIAQNFGKCATFMPKPIRGENGSGMHVHQSLWKDGNTLFAGNEYANLSKICLYYIGGIIKHSKALNAFTNPSTNSYKRLVPGYEAPVSLAYSNRNRSAAIRIPYVANDKARRIETRFPDPSANPYYCFASLLMAGIDGIKNQIDPGQAIEENLYEFAKDHSVPSVSGSLRESLYSLDQDREFLTKGGVFNDDQIDAYIKLKKLECDDLDQTPNPWEFIKYFSC